jgi:hypothetical protein
VKKNLGGWEEKNSKLNHGRMAKGPIDPRRDISKFWIKKGPKIKLHLVI